MHDFETTDAFPLPQDLGRAFSSPGEADPPAWQLVDVGRYQPQRIRGSCRGRALG